MEHKDEARKLNEFYVCLNTILLEFLESVDGVGRLEEIKVLSSELEKRFRKLETEN